VPSVRGGLLHVSIIVAAIELLRLSFDHTNGVFLDLQVYRVGGQAWSTGISLYGASFPAPLRGPALPFVYPPFAAILFAGLNAVSSFSVEAIIMWVASAVAAMVTCTLVVRRLGSGSNSWLVLGCGAGAAVLLLEPEFQNLGFGQVNMVLMGLVAVDLLAERTPWPRGTLIGIAAAIKLTPIVFVLFFLARRQWRPVAATAVSFAACGLVGALLAPRDSLLFWSKEMLNAGQRFALDYAANQSLRGALHRLALPPAVENGTWAALVIVVGVLVWVAVRRCVARGDDVLAMVVIATAALLASPVSWSAHWVWIAPALVLFAHRAVAERSIGAWAALCGGGFIFAVGPFWLLPADHGAELHWNWWEHLVGNSYLLCGLALVVVVAFRRPAAPQPAVPVAERELAEAHA
jgi:alpha-1,2-mannosyltransferase